MTDDIIRAIDATVDSLCACGCGTRLDPDGPSVWYVSEKHQNDHAHRTSEEIPPDVLDSDPYGGTNGWYERLRQQTWEQANLTVRRGGIRFPLTTHQQPALCLDDQHPEEHFVCQLPHGHEGVHRDGSVFWSPGITQQQAPLSGDSVPANCPDCNPTHPIRYVAKLTSIRVQPVALPRPNLLRRILATLTQPIRRTRP